MGRLGENDMVGWTGFDYVGKPVETKLGRMKFCRDYPGADRAYLTLPKEPTKFEQWAAYLMLKLGVVFFAHRKDEPGNTYSTDARRVFSW